MFHMTRLDLNPTFTQSRLRLSVYKTMLDMFLHIQGPVLQSGIETWPGYSVS